MKTPRALIASLCVSAAIVSAPVVRAAEKPDYKTIAERIVGTCANVKEGDRVVVRGDIRDMDLLEELSFAVYRRGAEPMQVVGREKAVRRYYDEVPPIVENGGLRIP